VTTVDDVDTPTIPGDAGTTVGDRPRAGSSQPSARGRLARRWARLWQWYGDRLWPSIVLLAVLATTATLSNSPGRYIGDNRFEQYFNPARRVAKTLSIWDAGRGLGRVREDFWPGTTIPMAAFRALGASPILTEHLWHALAIVIAGVGMVQVMRLFRPRVGAEHLLAALVVCFGAFSASFLTPFSNLYFQYALGPWFVWVFFRGLHSEHPWRWAAAFSLLVLAPGNVDTPGLLYNLMPLVSVAVYVVFVERSIRVRHLLGFVARAAPLVVLVNAAVLVKIWQGAATYGQRLNDTEAAEISFRASSWTESFRGLGNWISYFRDNGQLLKPQSALYFSNWFVILCTFVPPVIALLVIWLSRWRPRILFGLMALSSLVVLVGAYPLNEPSPLGVQVKGAFTDITFFFAFRNTYKAGAGLAMGVAALFGFGAAAIVRRLWNRSRDRQLAFLPAAAVVVAIVVISFPFWTNNLYNPTQQSEDIPEYWTQAFGYLDQRPDTTRLLILPETSRSQYRWGWVGDDIFDALLARPHAVATGVPLSTPLSANLLEAVSNEAANPAYRSGTLGPILRRLGISRIVIRNDLDWRALNRPRPSAYQAFREDPDFRLEASFGETGENTVEPGDRSPAAEAEAKLPPVEVWELKTPVAEQVRVESDRPSLLVSGDGAAWAPLSAAGVLNSSGPVVYTGSLDGARLRSLIDQGSPVAITDTNRRRLRVLLSYEPDYSHTLSEGQDLDRPTQSFFPGSGTQSVAWFPDATSIIQSGSPRPVSGSQPWYRPSNVFDGDVATTWLVRRADARRTFTVSLREPKKVDGAVFSIANVDSNDDGITKARLRFSDGSTETVNLGVGALNRATSVRTVDVSFPARTTTSIELTPIEAEGDKQLIGFADVNFEGLDLREFIQMPNDVFAATASDPALATKLDTAPMSYTFSRWTGEGPVSEELAIRRRFQSVGDRTYNVAGLARLRTSVSDAAIDRLVGGTVGAYATSRADGDPHGWAGFVVDGDPLTAWKPPARSGETLIVRFPRQIVSSVDISSLLEPTFSEIKRVQVAVGGSVQSVDVRTEQTCPMAPGKGCRQGTIQVPPTETDHVEIRLAELEGTGQRARIDEVRINGKSNDKTGFGASIQACHDIGLRLTGSDSAPRAIPVRLTGTLDDLLSGRNVTFTSCEGVRIKSGWNLFESGGGSAIDTIVMTAADGMPPRSPSGEPARAAVDTVASTRAHVSGQSPGGAVVILQQSYAKGWTAISNGVPLGSAIPMDTLNGWVIEDGGPFDLEISYGGQFLYSWALLITAFGVGLCLLLVLYRPRNAVADRDRFVPNVGPAVGERRVSTRGLIATSALAATVAYLLSGAGFAIVLGAVAVAVLLYRSDPGRPAALGAFILLVLAAGATIIEVTPSVTDPNLTFAISRQVTSLLGTLAGALTATAIALYALSERSVEPAEPWFALQDRRVVWRERVRLLPRLVDRWLVVGMAAVGAGALAYLIGPEALSSEYGGLIRNLRVGAAYSLVGPNGGPTAMIPPLAPGLAAYSPVAGRVLLSLVAMGSVLFAARVAYSRFGYRAALGAAIASVLIPAVWAVQLGVALASLAVLGAVALSEPARLRARRAVGAGICLGVAGLSRPDALMFALPVLIVWILWQAPERGRSLFGRMATMVITALVVMAPWLTYVRTTFATLLPADSLRSAFTDPNAADQPGGYLGVVLGLVVLGGACALIVRRGDADPRALVKAWLPYAVLPVLSVATAVVFPGGRNALGWSCLLVAVAYGYGLSPVLDPSARRRARPESVAERVAARRATSMPGRHGAAPDT